MHRLYCFTLFVDLFLSFYFVCSANGCRLLSELRADELPSITDHAWAHFCINISLYSAASSPVQENQPQLQHSEAQQLQLPQPEAVPAQVLHRVTSSTHPLRIFSAAHNPAISFWTILHLIHTHTFTLEYLNVSNCNQITAVENEVSSLEASLNLQHNDPTMVQQSQLHPLIKSWRWFLNRVEARHIELRR